MGISRQIYSISRDRVQGSGIQCLGVALVPTRRVEGRGVFLLKLPNFQEFRAEKFKGLGANSEGGFYRGYIGIMLGIYRGYIGFRV